ncbi:MULTISPECIES: phage tail tape measure protein [unclassified Deinococcus]|uniref:phage tail tape measure protein n=1 Tax=unclassified Deinococcus TaxID=2623546 RepID=UPI001C2F44CE|nr:MULTISPECIES: phage tail tape measure protein [unclassified Deinococcus]MDK2013576.1 phage tail tape measure protein [Deinococcus sp. 43]
MTSPTPLNTVASMDVTALRKGARDALNAIKEVTDFARKNGTLTLTAKLSGATPAALKGQISSALGTTPLKLPITLEQASIDTALNTLRTQLNAVVSVNTSALTAVQTQINTQLTELRALIAQLRALGGSGGAGGAGGGGGRSSLSANAQNLLADLEKLNTAYRRGDVDASLYAVRLAGLQSALRVASGTAAAGSAEFKALDQALTRTTQGLRQVQSDGITKLRTDLAGARAQFDAAAAAATNLAERRAAVAAYTADLTRIRTALQGVATSGQLTAQQLGTVNRLLAQTAREANTIQGRVNLAGLSGNVTNALSQLSAFVPGLNQVSGIMAGLPASFLGVAAAIAVFTAAMAASFKTAGQFQQGMADIKALTQPTAEGFDDLRAAALTIGEPLGIGARKAASGILELNRAGLTATQVIGGGLEGALNLAGAAGIELALASKLSTSAMTAFKLSAADLPRIADNFANFSNSTFLGAEDLSQAIAAVGPVAVSAGLSIEQFGGLMATAAQGGFKNMSDAGTSLKTMLLSLQSPSETGAAALERIGVNAYNADGSFRPFLETVDDLRGALQGMSEQGRNKVLKDVFGQDAIRIATILVDQNSEAIQRNIDVQGKAGEAARIAKERTATYQGEVDRLKARFERLQIVVGEKLLPVATKFVQFLSAGVGQLEDFANGTDNLLGYVLPLVAAFVAVRGAVIAAAAPAIWASLMGAVTTFFGTVSAWVASNPFGLVATAVAALAVSVNKIMQDTARIYDEIDQSANEGHARMMKRVQDLTAAGPELSRTQAKLLLAMDTLQNAEQGQLTGTNFWGERTYKVDPKQVEEARSRVEALRKEVGLLQNEAARRGTNGGAVAAVDPARVKEQSEAVRNLQATLADRSFQLKIGGLDGVEKEVAQLGKSFDELRKKVKASFGGNLNSMELGGALTAINIAQQNEEKAVRAKYAKEKADERRKDYQQAAAQARQGAFDVQRAEIQAMQEGRAKTQAERDLQLAELRDSVARQVAEYARYPELKAQAESGGRRQEVALRRQWQREDTERARQHAEAVASAEGEARAAVIASIADENERRRLSREDEIRQVRQTVRDRVAALAGYPAAQQRILNAGRTQEQALQNRWVQEDQQSARERAQRIAQAFQASADAELKARSAARDAEQAQVDLDTARRVAQARGNAEQIADIELDAQQRRLALQEQAAIDERDVQRRGLDLTLDQALRAQGLSQEERAALVRKYNADVAQLDGQFTAGQIKRAQDREQAERDAAEKIRQARITAAFQPAEDAQRQIRDVQREQGLAQSTADRLTAQRALTAAQAEYTARLAQGLTTAQSLNLTDEERRQRMDALADAQAEVIKGQQQEVDLARQLVLEARGVDAAYTRISLLLSDPGGATMQRELALATSDVADAYARATPYLQQFRTASLKPGDFNAAKDALEGLITALEAQRQKLEALRSEYDRQRTALQGVQDVLRGFGEEFGDVGLLEGAVQFNQGTYNQARAALTTLLQGGKYDAAQLAEATQKLQAAYGGLKDSVVAVGDAQASVFEKESRALQKTTDARLKVIDTQLEAARKAGNDTLVKSLEADRDRITWETETKVDELEARAEAARKAAQTALADRTKGLQQTLGAVAQGAQVAQRGVQDLGGQVKQAEKDLQTSADRMKASLTGVFKGLPAIAASAGQQAGQAFMQQLQAQLNTARLPIPTAAARAVPGGAGDTYVTNLYLNGTRAAATQDLQQLARDLTPLIRGEAQRRNPSGPCRGQR